MAYEVLKSELLHQGKIMQFRRDTLTMPDGNSAYREYITKGDAVAIVAVNAEGKLLMVEQYRHPLKAMVLEIPAGVIEPGEDPEETAGRELEEETGFYCENIKFLFKMHMSVGISTEAIYLYLAEDLKVGKQNLDADEFLTVSAYSVEDLLKMIADGKLTDAKTVAGILAYQGILSKK